MTRRVWGLCVISPTITFEGWLKVIETPKGVYAEIFGTGLYTPGFNTIKDLQFKASSGVTVR